jgi:hypothetical protein
MKVALRAAAIAAYGAYWGLWLFGYLDIHRTGVMTGVPRVLFGALVIALPCFLLGAAVGRWWAPVVGLFFVAFAALPDHCVTVRSDDFTSDFCSGLYGSDLPLILAITTPCVLAGVAAVKLLARLRRPAPAV